MANRYNTPAQAQFMNSYVPIPFQELLQAGVSKQQQYNTGQAVLDTAQSQADALKSIPNSEDERYITEDVMGTVKEIVDEYGSQDFSDPVVMRAINKRLGSLNKKRINNIQSSAAKWEDSENIKAQMFAKGETPFKPFDSTGYDTRSKGVYSYTPRATLDYEAGLQEFFSQIGEEYLGDWKTNEGRMGSFHGRSKNKIQDYTNANADIAAADPRIQQLMEARGLEPTKENVLNTLLSESPRFETSRMTSSYVDPGYTAPNNQSVRNTSTEFILEEEPYDSTFKNVNKARKEKIKTDEAISKIDQQIKSYTKSVNPLSAQNIRLLEQQKAALQSQTYAIDHHFDKLSDEYDTRHNQSLDSQYSKAFEKVKKAGIDLKHTESIIQEVIKKMSSSDTLLEKDFFGFYNDIADPENTAKQGSNLLAEDLGSMKDAFKVRTAINNAIKDINKYKDSKKEYIDKEWGNLVKGEQKSTTILPATNSDGTKILIPGTQTWIFNPLNSLEQAFESNPESMDIRRITGAELSPKQLVKDQTLIKETLEGSGKSKERGRIDFQTSGTFDPESPFLNAVLYDGDGNRVDNFAVHISNKSQQSKIAETYAIIGDYQNAIRYENPQYSQGIAKVFEKGVKPKELNISLLGNNIRLELDQNEEFYNVYSAGSLQGVIPAEGSSVESSIYNLLDENINPQQ